MEEVKQPEEKRCVCGGMMRYQGRQLLYLREPGFFHFESYADYAEVEVYICPQCRRGDFFFPVDLVPTESGPLARDFDYRSYYRERYEAEDTRELHKMLTDRYLPSDLKELVREVLAERGEGESSRAAEKPQRAEPWTKGEEKKGFFSSLFGSGDEKPKKNRPPEF